MIRVSDAIIRTRPGLLVICGNNINTKNLSIFFLIPVKAIIYMHLSRYSFRISQFYWICELDHSDKLL